MRTFAKRVLLGSTAAVLLFPMQALAQTSPAASDSSKLTRLEEVVVTATKTGASRLQDTPLAISAFSSDQLARTLSSNVKDLAQFTPSLNISIANTAAVITLRGIGTNNVGNGSDPDVTMQVDGVYISRPSAMGNDFLDVDRVEVLRGPQGTLYGRNAIGGTINIISPKPSDNFHGTVALTGGNFGLGQVQAYVNGPIIPGKLQGTLSGSYVRRDDYQTNIVPNAQSGVNNANHGGLRGQLRFEPTDWLEMTTRADLVSQDEHLQNNYNLQVPAPGAPLANSIIGDDTKVALNSPSTVNLHGSGMSEEINLLLGPQLSLKSITAYRQNTYAIVTDNDGTELKTIVGHFQENEHQRSEELSLTGKFGALHAVVGAYYYDEASSTNVFAQLFGPGVKIQSLPYFKDRSVAEFAQGTYHVTPTFSLTAGIRQTSETKSINSTVARTRFLTNGSLLPGFPIVFNVSKTFNAVTPKFGADWKVTPNFLFYATATRGYKSGGTNYAASSAATASFNPETLWSYEAGFKADLFDRRLRFNMTGFHYDYSNLQIQSVVVPGVVTILNAASATVDGVETEVTAKLPQNIRIDASISGLNARYSTFTTASVPAAILPFVASDPRYNSVSKNYNASGKSLNQAPRFSGSVAVQKDFDLKTGAVFTARGDVYFQDREFYEPTNSLKQSQSAYFLVNGQLGYTSADKAWQIQLWGKNLFDKHYLIAFQANGVEPAGTAAAPRTFGVRLTRSW